MAIPELAVPQPFYYLAHHATQRPDAIAMACAERTYTYEEVRRYAVAIAGELRARGVVPGDLVASWVGQELQLFFLEAIFHEAAIWCNPPSEAVLTGDLSVDWLLAHEPVPSFASDRTIIVDNDFLLALRDSTFDGRPHTYPSMESVCRLSLSSGTTGVPLAIPSTVARISNVRNDVTEFYPYLSLMRGFTGSSAKSATNEICRGSTFICAGSPDDNVTVAQKNFVATIHGSPLQIAAFLDVLEQREDRSTSIVEVQFVGSYLSPALLERVHQVLGARVTALYGSTETGLVTKRVDVRSDTHNVGAPLPGAAVEIVDANDNVLAPGEEGIVRTKTRRENVGYFRNENATRAHVKDGWFYPGDLGRLNEHGELELSGRLSEVINVGGVKFNPDVLDARLVQMPNVRDGAIISWAPNGDAGYAALVVTDDGVDLTQLSEPLRLASGGVPPAGIFRVPAIQRGVTGKVQRAALTEWVSSVLKNAAPST